MKVVVKLQALRLLDFLQHRDEAGRFWGITGRETMESRPARVIR